MVSDDVNIGEGVVLDFSLMRDDPQHWYNYITYNFMIFLRLESTLI